MYYFTRWSAGSTTEEAKPSQNPKPPPPPAAASKGGDRDLLLHLDAYLARRDGVDKILKISRYAAKIVLSTSLPSDSLSPRLRAFESSVGISRKAFRLGKFVHDVNALRAAADSPTSADRLLAAVAAYGGEGLYFFVEQFVWLSKAGLISSEHSRRLHKVGAWAELVAHFGSVTLKAKELRKIRSCLTKSMDGKANDQEIRKLREKLLLQEMWLVQDLADSLMVIADVSDGKGFLSNPLLMASVGILSALIGAYKNWISC